MQYVVDFIELLYFAIFNVADMFINAAAGPDHLVRYVREGRACGGPYWRP